MKPIYIKLVDREKSLLGDVEIVHDVVYWAVRVQEQPRAILNSERRQILHYVRAGYQDKSALMRRMRNLRDGEHHLDWLISNGWVAEEESPAGAILIRAAEKFPLAGAPSEPNGTRIFDTFGGAEILPSVAATYLPSADLDPAVPIMEKPRLLDSHSDPHYIECLVMLIYHGTKRARSVRVYHQFDEIPCLQDVLYDLVLEGSEIIKRTKLAALIQEPSSDEIKGKGGQKSPPSDSYTDDNDRTDDYKTTLSQRTSTAKNATSHIGVVGDESPTGIDHEARQFLQPQRLKPFVEVVSGRSAHELLLGEALRDARSRLLIVTPFIRRRVVDPLFQQHLVAALRRGVDVLVVHGMPVRSDSFDDTDFENQRIENLVNDVGHQHRLKFVRVTGAADSPVGEHSKILVCDDRWAVVSSFNWLSFQETNETGVLIRDAASVAQLLGLFESYLKSAAETRAEDATESRVEVDTPWTFSVREMSEWNYGEYNSQ